MINTMALLMDSWYAAISGISVNVYKGDVPITETGHYVVIRPEGETYAGNKRSFADESVVIVDIVAVFPNGNVVNMSVPDSIDSEITAIILPTTQTTGLSAQSGMQILNVQRETSTYLQEEDDVNKYLRKISRYRHRIQQTA